MQKRKATLLFAALLLLLSFLSMFSVNSPSIVKAQQVDPSVVGTDTLGYALLYSYQRKSFYANGRFWVFYSDGTNMVYSTSTDGITWTTPSTIRAVSYGCYFSVWFDGTYVHYAVITAELGKGAFYRRGTPNADGTITWSTASEQTVLPEIGNVYYYIRKTNAGVANAPDLWVMDGSYSFTANYTTEIVTGTTAAGNYYYIKPMANNTVANGTALPTTITLQGWRTSTPVTLTTPLATSIFFVFGYVKNRAAVAHAGYIYARLWKSPNPDMSSAVAITDWAYASISFTATAGEEKPFSIRLQVTNPPNSEYLYVEFVWRITTAATDATAGLYLRADTNGDAVKRSAQFYTYPYVSVDSNGYPYICVVHYDGYYYYPYVVASSLNNGTWATASGFPYRLSTTSSSYWKVSAVPLTDGKMLAVYAYNGETIKARRWTGSNWDTEVATTSAISFGSLHSAVAQGDDVHLVFLKSTGYDILYTKYSYASNSFSDETTLVAGATNAAAPVLSIDTSTNDLYVFAATTTTETPSGWTANHIYYIKYTASSGTWGSWTDWIDETTEVLTYPNGLTCFYQAYGNYIGLEYMTKTASPYNVKFASTLLFPLRLPAYGTTISFAENLTASNIQCFNDKIILINASLGSEPEKANITLTVKNANLTISQLSHNKKFIAELNGPTGTLAELTVTHSLYTHMPGTVAVAGLPLTTPCATKEDFDSYGGNTWYYDTATNTVYVKAVLHSPTSIYIDWNPPPAPYVPTPTPQPTITPPTPTTPSWLIILIIAIATVIGYAALKRRR